MQQQTSIPLSRTKLFIVAFICLLFICLCWWLFNQADTDIRSHMHHDNPYIFRLSMVVIMVFCFAFLLWLIIKLFSNKPGLQFIENGFIENTNIFSIGFIAWEDIIGFEIAKDPREKMLYVLLRDPEKYIVRCNFVKRKLLRLSMKMGPSPVTITSVSLKMDFPDVVAILKSNLASHQNA